MKGATHIDRLQQLMYSGLRFTVFARPQTELIGLTDPTKEVVRIGEKHKTRHCWDLNPGTLVY